MRHACAHNCGRTFATMESAERHEAGCGITCGAVLERGACGKRATKRLVTGLLLCREHKLWRPGRPRVLEGAGVDGERVTVRLDDGSRLGLARYRDDHGETDTAAIVRAVLTSYGQRAVPRPT